MDLKKSDFFFSMEQHLANLASCPRIEILKRLQDQVRPVEYRELQQAILKCSNETETKNLSYHINVLKDSNYIIQKDRGYLLTSLGNLLVKQLIIFEKALVNNPEIFVRTSKYTLEPFDESIIENKLTEESNIDTNLAKKIASEAKQRLMKANITYLTAPLIREFVNAILIENHLEDTRHQLTRLGLPPFDVNNLINSQPSDNPNSLKIKLGISILEQNILLNKINQKFADNLLSAEYNLSDLSNFGIIPLELVISGQNLIDMLNKYYLQSIRDESNSDEQPLEDISEHSVFKLSYVDFLDYFNNLLILIQPFFSFGLIIVRFDEFLEIFLKYYKKQHLKHLFFKIWPRFTKNWNISIGISLIANYNDIDPLFEIYDQSLSLSIKKWSRLPVLELFFPKNKIKELLNCSTSLDLKYQQKMVLRLLKNHQVNINQFSKRGVQNCDHIFTNLGVPVQFNLADNLEPSIILEKISINLLAIFKNSKNNDSLFFSNLEKAVFSIFDYFDKKFHLLSKSINNFNEWSDISFILFNNKKIFQNLNEMQNYILKYPIYCGLSLFGLDEMIYLKTGLFIKDQTKNRDFAVKVIDFIYSLIQKQNIQLNNKIKFIFCEQHYQKELVYPNDQFINNIYLQDDNFDKNSKLGYRFGFKSSSKSLKINHLCSIYSDLNRSKFKELSINYSLLNDNNKLELNHFLKLVQNLIKTNTCRISFSRNYEILNEDKSKITYKRFLLNYSSFI